MIYGVSMGSVHRWRRNAGILSRPQGSRPKNAHGGRASIEKWTDEDFRVHVAKAYSFSDVLRSLGVADSNTHLRQVVKARMSRLGISTEHFTMSKRHYPLGREGAFRYTTKDILSGLHENFKSSAFKKRLIDEGYKINLCEICGQTDTWNNQPLTLQLDHINGRSFDNRLENLRILCPNCHSQTPTYGSKNRQKIERPLPEPKQPKPKQPRKDKPKQPSYCSKCGKTIHHNSRWCSVCSPSHREKGKWPALEDLKKMVWETPMSQLAPLIGVSDVAIKKRCVRLGIQIPHVGYWAQKHAGKLN